MSPVIVTQVQDQGRDQSNLPALADALLAWSGLVWLGGIVVGAVLGVVTIGVPEQVLSFSPKSRVESETKAIHLHSLMLFWLGLVWSGLA